MTEPHQRACRIGGGQEEQTLTWVWGLNPRTKHRTRRDTAFSTNSSPCCLCNNKKIAVITAVSRYVPLCFHLGYQNRSPSPHFVSRFVFPIRVWSAWLWQMGPKLEVPCVSPLVERKAEKCIALFPFCFDRI